MLIRLFVFTKFRTIKLFLKSAKNRKAKLFACF